MENAATAERVHYRSYFCSHSYNISSRDRELLTLSTYAILRSIYKSSFPVSQSFNL